ncbi:MAG: phosphatidylglycerophosphatase A [Myxococcales bacterium FL481]|nr:MAG: phosphatidylglycerophosphatase A [Myxococcales bacterium FL481]
MTGSRGNRCGRVAGMIATVGPLGHLPLAPGTWGAAAAVVLAPCLASTPMWRVWFGWALVTGVAWWAVDLVLADRRDDDPREVVIDEFVGCGLALSCVPAGWGWWLAAFALFRWLDIRKPSLIGWCDRSLHGATGVIADDVLAGVAAGVSVAGFACVAG